MPLRVVTREVDIIRPRHFHVGMFRLAIVLLALGICLPVASLRAQLAWEKTEVELHPSAEDATAVGVFKYQNKGEKPVHITSVHTSCGCTTAGAVKNDVAPGEKGEITATFNIGGRTGVQQKTVTVTTDDAKQPTTLLTLKAIITVAVEVQPSFVFWNLGEQPTAKMITVKTSSELAVKSLEVAASTADFTTKVQPGSGAGEFQIAVQPRDTAKAVVAGLTITPVGAAAGKAYHATARVTNAKAAQ